MRKKRVAFTEIEEKIWKGWRPLMRFPLGEAVAEYLALREKVGKLTARGCDLAYLFEQANLYATLRSGEEFRRERVSRPQSTKLEKKTRYVSTAQGKVVEQAEKLGGGIEALRDHVNRAGLTYRYVGDCLARFETLPEQLRSFAEALDAARQPTHPASELEDWRRERLVLLVNHVKTHGVKQFWKSLAALVSCWRPQSVHMEWTEEFPNFTHSESEQPLRRTAEKLRLEYSRISRK